MFNARQIFSIITYREKIRDKICDVLNHYIDINDPDYFNIPNMLWSRNVTIAPENGQNNTEIIFTNQPRATINEIVQPFLQPVNLENVSVEKSGSDSGGVTGNYSITIDPIPSSQICPIIIRAKRKNHRMEVSLKHLI